MKYHMIYALYLELAVEKKEKEGVGRDPNVSIGDWCAIIHTLF